MRYPITSATADAIHIARMTRSAEATADDPTKVVTTSTPAHRADAGMAWGTLIHGLLEHAMRHRGVSAEDLRRLAMWLTVDEPQLRTVLDEAVETVQRVAQADFWQAAKAGEHSEEVPFAVADAETLTNGVIDLLFKSGDAWRIRDYKTDLALTKDVYERQLLSYREAQAVGITVNVSV
jgi:ATP-dependent exoDNAse (exonuclease V) beta subunit